MNVFAASQTIVGFNDVKSIPVYFYAQRSYGFSGNGTAISYESAPVNIGGGLDVSSGIFTAPVSGRYFLAFSATTNTFTHFVLQLNGVEYSSSVVNTESSHYNQASQESLLDLKQGDRVNVAMILEASLERNGPYFWYAGAHFTGMLMEEDLVLTPADSSVISNFNN